MAVSLQQPSTLPSGLMQQQQGGFQPAQPSQMSYLDDTSSIAMFTAVGHVGLHLVLRPLVRWGIRSWALRAKKYDINNTNDKEKNKNNKNDNVLANESQIASELEESTFSIGSQSKESKSTLKKTKNRNKKSKGNLSNVSSGIASPYSEIVSTFGTLAGITYVAHPQNVLLYFGITYPSMPFILRFLATLNDKKSSMTLARTIRLSGKSLIVTAGFGISMALVGAFMQNIPFFNIFCLAMWDSFADFVISDGPNK